MSFGNAGCDDAAAEDHASLYDYAGNDDDDDDDADEFPDDEFADSANHVFVATDDDNEATAEDDADIDAAC